MPDMVKTISDIFSNQVFHIPDYQRGYAWEEKQWNDLLEDLELLPVERNHFTGTLVLSRVQDEGKKILDQYGKAYTAYEVIDGQQRLTTIVILLKAIHEEMQSFPQFENLATGLRESFLYHIDLIRQPFTKLKLNSDSQEYFADNILGLNPGIGGPTIRSHQRLSQARQHFGRYLAAKQDRLGDAYPDWLQTLYLKLIHQLTMIVYPVNDELDAGVIFETMNDRGQPLTELEKVKNYLLYLSSKLDLPTAHDLPKRINRAWTHIYEYLMAAGLAGRQYEDQLLRAHWLMAYDHDVSHWENSRSIKNRFSLKRYQGRHDDLLHDLVVYLTGLVNAATAYCDIFRPARAEAFNDITRSTVRQQIILWSKKLARLGPRVGFLPILISVRLKASDDGETYLKTVKRCEIFDFRVFQLRRARANAGETTLYRLANQYYRTGSEAWLLEEIDQLCLRYCSQEAFIERFDRPKENWYNWRGISYFLYEYEHHLAGGRPVELTWEILQGRPKAQSIEHILPQTPEDPYWLDRFTKEQRERWTHDLGNLTLTYDNSSLGNRSFAAKKGAPGVAGTYANSPLFIEKQVAGCVEWTETEIIERREAMKTWALVRWKIEAKPRENKPPKNFDDVVEDAEQYGLADAVRGLHNAAGRLGMWPTIRKGLQYRSPRNYRQSVMVVYVYSSGIGIHFRLQNFGHIRNLSAEKAAETLDAQEGWNWYPPDKLPALLEAMDELCRISKGE